MLIRPQKQVHQKHFFKKNIFRIFKIEKTKNSSFFAIFWFFFIFKNVKIFFRKRFWMTFFSGLTSIKTHQNFFCILYIFNIYKIIKSLLRSIYDFFVFSLSIRVSISWVIKDESLSKDIQVTSRDDSGTIMSIKHNAHDVRGVQFHPESIMTEHGEVMVSNFLNQIKQK